MAVCAGGEQIQGILAHSRNRSETVFCDNLDMRKQNDGRSTLHTRQRSAYQYSEWKTNDKKEEMQQ